MKIKPEEITQILRDKITGFEKTAELEETGQIVQVGDGIATVYGLKKVKASELVLFENGSKGLALNLDEDSVGVVVLGEYHNLKEGQLVKRTGKIVSVPVGEAMLGRVVNPLGEPLDGKGPIVTQDFREIEFKAPGVIYRQPVNTPLQTGLKSIDSMIPIGRGQRELIIGDRQTGKTAIALDTIINQKGKNAKCIYVAIGQKAASVARIVDQLEQFGAMDYTTVVFASASDPASMLYIAPYTGCAIGEHFMYQGQDALVVYDDLTKHAASYRELSLLLRRPPGREAYPGDVFYLHSRLLERAARLNPSLGGGSLTALPIIETQANDLSAYIPTNVISITDGQIYLEAGLFYAGFRPAINIGLSVSRVGGTAQIKAMKKIAGTLRLDLAQYRDLESFSQFASELDEATRSQLTRGEKLMELLKQNQYSPIPVEEQVISIFAGVRGFLDTIPTHRIRAFEEQLIRYVKHQHPEILSKLKEQKDLSTELTRSIEEAIKAFKKVFVG